MRAHNELDVDTHETSVNRNRNRNKNIKSNSYIRTNDIIL